MTHACLKIKWGQRRRRYRFAQRGGRRKCIRGHEDHAFCGPRLWLPSRTRRLGAVLDSEPFGMTSPADLGRTLPRLQDRFAISVVHLTEYHGLGILVQK